MHAKEDYEPVFASKAQAAEQKAKADFKIANSKNSNKSSKL